MDSQTHEASSVAPEHVYSGLDANRLRDLLLLSRLSPSKAACALGVEENTLLNWCQPNGKLQPPYWAIHALSRLAALRGKPYNL